MRRGLLAESPPFTQLIITVFTMLVCFMLVMFVGVALALPIFGISFSELTMAMTGVDAMRYINVIRYIQCLQGISLFILPALFLGHLFSGSAVGYFGFKNFPQAKSYGLVLLVMITAIPAINLLASLNEMIVFPESLSWLEAKFRSSENAAKHITELFLSVDNLGGLLFNIFMIALLPALGEELLFRGVLQKILVRWSGNVHAGIIVSAFLFSLMHMQFYGLFPRWILGIMFGYMMIWSGSIWLPIVAHFFNNAMATIVSYFINKNSIPEEVATYGASWGALPITLLLTLACVCFFWLIRKNELKYT